MTEYPDICLVTNPIGATENAVLELLNILSTLTSVSLITANLPDDSPIDDEYEVTEISRRRTINSIPLAAVFFLANQIRMCNIIRTRDENVIWFFGATSYLLPIIFARWNGKTVVLQPRGNIPLTLQLHWEQHIPRAIARMLAGTVRKFEHTGYHLAHAIVTYTPAMTLELGLDQFERKVYSNGARYVDTDQFYPRMPYQERDRVVGFLGRLDEEKGIRTLAEVARNLPDDTTFVFAGDGDLRTWLESTLTDEIESGSVEVTGWLDHDEVPAVLSRFKLLVLPSQPTEGLPTVILEAFACGTPVYATPVSGIPDIVRNGDTGYIMTNNTPRGITDEIDIILQDELAIISQNARNLAKNEYHFYGAVNRYHSIITSI